MGPSLREGGRGSGSGSGSGSDEMMIRRKFVKEVREIWRMMGFFVILFFRL